jgi:hypothetical protein
MLLDPKNISFSHVINKQTGSINEGAFSENFDMYPNGTIFPKSPERFARIIRGLVSYFHPGPENYPTVIVEPPIQVRMLNIQNNNYWLTASKEAFTRKIIPVRGNMSEEEFKKKMVRYLMATQYILSRHLSNSFYPPSIKNAIDEVEPNGWISKSFLQNNNFLQMSSKITALCINISAHPNAKHVIFTFAKTKSGVNLIQSLFKICGWKSSVFSGDTPTKKRNKILSDFNGIENRYGRKIPILLITTAGAEGITIMEAQHMHILESSPRPNLTRQAIGRIVRYKSHFLLPPEERFVHIWKYWSLSTNDDLTVRVEIHRPNIDNPRIPLVSYEIIPQGDTVDIALFKRGVKELNEIDSFLSFLGHTSIETLPITEKNLTTNMNKLRRDIMSFPNPEKVPNRPLPIYDETKVPAIEIGNIDPDGQLEQDGDYDQGGNEKDDGKDDDIQENEIYSEQELHTFKISHIIQILSEEWDWKHNVEDKTKSELIQIILSLQKASGHNMIIDEVIDDDDDDYDDGDDLLSNLLK